MRSLEPPRRSGLPRLGGGRLAGIEGLRALAASAIVAFHVWDDTAAVGHSAFQHVFLNLRAGVTLFFVLSGFLLYRPFAAAVMRRAPRPSIRRYSINRALRILPAYWVILLLDALFLDRELLVKPLQLATNFFLLQNYVPAYQPNGDYPLGLAPAWSVVVEASFYVALPLLALLAVVLARRVRLAPVSAALSPVAVLLVGGVAAFVAFRLFPEALGQTWQKYSLPSYATWFAAGMALAVIRVLWEDGRLRISRWWQPSAAVSALVLALASCKLYYAGVLQFNEYQAFVAVACAVMMSTIVLTSGRTRVVRALEWRPIVAVGLASYSVFLWNDPIIRKLRDNELLMAGPSGLAVNLLFVGVITGAASWLTYRYVEKRALALKRAGRPQTQRAAETDATDAEPLGSMERSDLPARTTTAPLYD